MHFSFQISAMGNYKLSKECSSLLTGTVSNKFHKNCSYLSNKNCGKTANFNNQTYICLRSSYTIYSGRVPLQGLHGKVLVARGSKVFFFN